MESTDHLLGGSQQRYLFAGFPAYFCRFWVSKFDKKKFFESFVEKKHLFLFFFAFFRNCAVFFENLKMKKIALIQT